MAGMMRDGRRRAPTAKDETTRRRTRARGARLDRRRRSGDLRRLDRRSLCPTARRPRSADSTRSRAVAPPSDLLKPAIDKHTETVLDLASKLAKVEIVSLDVVDLGGGVFRVRRSPGTTASSPSHTKMAVRARSRTCRCGSSCRRATGVELVTGHPMVTSERLEGTSGTVEGEWLVRAAQRAGGHGRRSSPRTRATTARR